MLHGKEMEEGTQASSRKTKGEIPHGRPKIRWEDNINWDSEEVDYEDDWKTLAQERVTWHAYVLAAMNLRVP